MNATPSTCRRPDAETAHSVSPAVVKQALTLLVSMGLAFTSGVAQAQSTTHFKAGIGVATTSYRTTDELRDAQERPLTDTTGHPLPDDKKIDLNQGNWHAFLEWYTQPQLAFGLQFQQAFGKRSLPLAANQTAT